MAVTGNGYKKIIGIKGIESNEAIYVSKFCFYFARGYGLMALRSKIFRGAIALTAGQAATQSLSLIRNIIVARLLDPENMGIAATFAITITLLEMTSNMGVDMLLVQSKDGDAPVFQGTAHLYQIIRGLLVGLIILLFAPIIAYLFNIPQAQWAFCFLAIVPIFRGFMHLDWKRLQRHMHFRSTIIVELVPHVIATIAAFPLATLLGDYSAVLWLVIMQAAAGMLISHLFAQRPYRINWNQGFASRILIFGWPLLINGLFLFGAMQGDRLIIGAAYSMTDLGVYSVAFSLALTISFVFGKMSISLLLPLLSNVQSKKIEFRRRYVLFISVFALLSGMVALPFITAGGHMVILIFGNQYSAAFTFTPWLGGLLAARIFRFVPTTAALAYGDTKNSMFANIFRIIGVAAAALVAWQKLPLSTVIVCGIGGELLALIFATLRLNRRYNIKLADSLFAPLIVSLILILAGTKNFLYFETTNILRDFGFLITSLFVLIAIAILCLPMLRSEIQHSFNNVSWRFLKKNSS